MKIEIYYDGTDIENNSGNDVKGFTTNISFLRSAGVTDYPEFIRHCLQYSKGRPISFQLYDDNDEDIERVAVAITSFDPSILVKIPVIKTDGSSNAAVIKKLHDKGVKVNVTAIFTEKQVHSIKDCFGLNTDVIVSIFAGRLNDCGVNSENLVKYASKSFSDYPNVKILWAACRTVYNVLEAELQGADIVTVPDSVLKRLHRLQDDPAEAGLKAVQQFRDDGLATGLKV
tara:strand:- start:6034 stop:6720 length:687 start_codon:yes stop_codon:yes gene_type:complete